jgi:hypothetical protein
MQRLWFVIFLAVLAVSLILLSIGIFGTEHKFYTRFGKTVPGYSGTDPLRIREWSFG